MNSEPNSYVSKKAPQWMRDMFEELSGMFEELFPDTDKLNLEEMQQRLDEREQPIVAARSNDPCPFDVEGAPAIFDCKIATNRPTQLSHALAERNCVDL